MIYAEYRYSLLLLHSGSVLLFNSNNSPRHSFHQERRGGLLLTQRGGPVCDFAYFTTFPVLSI